MLDLALKLANITVLSPSSASVFSRKSQLALVHAVPECMYVLTRTRLLCLWSFFLLKTKTKTLRFSEIDALLRSTGLGLQ